MSLDRGIAVDVVRASHLERYRLEVTFGDGHVSIIDFGPFLRGSLNPETRQFLDEKRFKSFSLSHGNLIWGDYEMCFPVEDLYEGCISRKEPAGATFAVAEPHAQYVTKKRTRS